MELKIDFYSKEDVAVRMDFSGRYPFPANETSELFLYTCYCLRQLSNLGNHAVAKVLAVLLTTVDEKTLIELAQDKYEFPGPAGLGFLMGVSSVRIGVDYDTLRSQLLTGLPRLVDFRGEGKKYFYLKVPSVTLHHKGFGLLGFQVNYYAFHSVIALTKYLAKRHIKDDAYLTHFSHAAISCGKLHIAQKIPVIGDQVEIANTILKAIGVIS